MTRRLVLARSRQMAKPLAAAVVARAEDPRLPSGRTPTPAARAAAGPSDRLPSCLNRRAPRRGPVPWT